MQSRPPGSPDPQPLPSPDDSEAPQFLSTGALQDPTLRTPGSEIPESVYAASDSSSFHIRPIGTEPLPKDRPSLAIALALLLLAIMAATAVYLYRDTRRQPASPPHTIVRLLPSNRLT